MPATLSASSIARTGRTSNTSPRAGLTTHTPTATAKSERAVPRMSTPKLATSPRPNATRTSGTKNTPPGRTAEQMVLETSITPSPEAPELMSHGRRLVMSFGTTPPAALPAISLATSTKAPLRPPVAGTWAAHGRLVTRPKPTALASTRTPFTARPGMPTNSSVETATRPTLTPPTSKSPRA
jgi:hypothetical protein